jgi:hypothetical protein
VTPYRKREKNDIVREVSISITGKLVITLASVILFGIAVAWIVELLKKKYKVIESLPWFDSNATTQEMLDLSHLHHRHLRWTRYLIYSTAWLGTIGRALTFSLLAVLLLR